MIVPQGPHSARVSCFAHHVHWHPLNGRATASQLPRWELRSIAKRSTSWWHCVHPSLVEVTQKHLKSTKTNPQVMPRKSQAHNIIRKINKTTNNHSKHPKRHKKHATYRAELHVGITSSFQQPGHRFLEASRRNVHQRHIHLSNDDTRAEAYIDPGPPCGSSMFTSLWRNSSSKCFFIWGNVNNSHAKTGKTWKQTTPHIIQLREMPPYEPQEE